ncbi:hypothetical protein C2S51_001739 [Perilla frutescens var. frutescens]|nr:hypothetical protein C2S51_001739 [Perilla frutescens var. frutescens]
MAAAYAALVSVLNDLEDIQNHPIHSFSFDHNQIQSLFQIVTFLIGFMESYDNCYGPSKEAAQLLDNEITIAAQAAEQVIESHVVHQILSGSTLGGKKRKLLGRRWDLEKVIEDMNYVRSKAIKVQEARSGLELKQPTYSKVASSSSTQPDLISDKTTMVGFDKLLIQLLDVLTGYHSSRQVIPIVGTGGIGKTTLAKNSFDHKLIVQHFDIRLWATISQQYVVQDILLTLLSRQPKSDNENVGQLGEQLHKRLFGRRYLIVLDDMWNKGTWEEIMSFFPDTNNGSRIVVTTRLSDMANQIGSVSPLAVSLLDKDKSWDLFCEKVFAAGEGCPRELEDAGKSIARKCRGLPLAIVVVAGHLGKSTRSQKYWLNVASNMKSVLNSEENEQLFDILSFSYIHLPVHLKPCFVYMGTFREDEPIDVEELIDFWIAEGFLKQCKADNLEETAKGYLKDLIDRNLILDSPGTENCKIHDVLRELCLKVAEKEMFFYNMDYPKGGRAICRERRTEIFDAPTPLVRCLNLRWGERKVPSCDLRMCRVLQNSHAGEGFLEANIQHVNLRCVYGFEYMGRDLPSSISLFWKLQTLIIGADFSSVIIAPNKIWEMIQLRHLHIFSGIDLPDPLPSDKLKRANKLVMRKLRTLWTVHNMKLSEEFCKRVPNIKELKVGYSGEVRSDYCPHNLRYLCKLESLELEMHNADRDSAWREFVLSLTFPSSLKELCLIDGGFIDWEEMTMMVGSLPHLEALRLEFNSVIGSEWTLVEGIKFPGLKSLKIDICNDLVKWNADSSNFPVLENLVLTRVPRLEELPSDIGTIPTLRSITLMGCSVSLAISAIRILVEQEDQGNEDLRLHVHFTHYQVFQLKEMMEEEGLTPNNLFL